MQATTPLHKMPVPREQLEIPMLIFPCSGTAGALPLWAGGETMMSSRGALPGMSSWGGAGLQRATSAPAGARPPSSLSSPPTLPRHPLRHPATAPGERRRLGND